ncbi:hypothetical protein Ahy_B01g055406 [Arachis hypogaea]|uniref:Uncharacterized protein n=1 Tax=Arachis hypogaea TaxID=3818 RepID=A0A445AW31_ARAHY|nr:hypothetical protein Ahy_B01g055406 [Arachis hypogaea]
MTTQTSVVSLLYLFISMTVNGNLQWDQRKLNTFLSRRNVRCGLIMLRVPTVLRVLILPTVLTIDSKKHDDGEQRDGNKVSFDEPNPFANEGEEVASVAYRYRRWKLDLICISWRDVKCMYSGVDWRQKLETQRVAVLATKLKNNANKLPKWTAQALLAGADIMKLGYVSKIHPRDYFNHVIFSSLYP